MQTSIEITVPAEDFTLVSLDNLKLALRITGTAEDDFLKLIISWASAEVATYCNRVFAKETVVETITEIPNEATRIFLSRWPLLTADLDSVEVGGAALTIDTDFALDEISGKLTDLTGEGWAEPVVVTYSGGYELPDESPLALQHTTILFAREAYFAAQRGDQSIRMVAHKESRIIYFDPNIANRAVASAGSPAQRAAKDLLAHFTRFEV